MEFDNKEHAMMIKNHNNNVEMDDMNENRCAEDFNKLGHKEKMNFSRVSDYDSSYVHSKESEAGKDSITKDAMETTEIKSEDKTTIVKMTKKTMSTEGQFVPKMKVKELGYP